MAMNTSLAAGSPAEKIRVVVCIPSTDRENRPIHQEIWTEECLTVLKRLFGDAWVDAESWQGENCKRLVFDDTMLVISYADRGGLTDEALEELQPFLHRLGRESREGEAGIVIWDGVKETYFTEFDAIEIDCG